MEDLTKYLNADPAAAAAYASLTQIGGKVYIVGGAVRDMMLDKKPKDIDLMCAGLDGDSIRDALKETGGQVVLTGKRFGVYRLRLGGFEVEVAQPRTDEYEGYTHKPDVTVDPHLPIEDDLLRRDFTANAMAFDPQSKQVIDPFGGAQDIQDGRLRMTNPAAFAQDPVRLVRVLAAYSKHGLVPDPDMIAAMKQAAPAIKQMPREAVREELEKAFAGQDPASALELAHETGLLHYILPELDHTFGFEQKNVHHNLDVGAHSMQALRHMTTLTDDPDLRFAMAMHDVGKPGSFWVDENGNGHFYKKISPNGETIGENHEELGAQMTDRAMKRLKYTNDQRERVTHLVSQHMFAPFQNERGARKFLANNAKGDPDTAWDLMRVRESDANGKGVGLDVSHKDIKFLTEGNDHLRSVVDSQQAVSIKDLAVTGKDLLDIGIPAGPQIGELLRGMLAIVIDHPEENQKSILMQYARSMTS